MNAVTRTQLARQVGELTAQGMRLPEMVSLPGGPFAMGSDNGRADERPVHDVFVGPFALGRYPVTNAEYAVFLRATGWPEPKEWDQPGFVDARNPVCGVSWVDAVRFCEWLNEARTADADGASYHLPTEAQRQYAALGGVNGIAYPWGDEEPPAEGYYACGQDGSLTSRPMPVGTVPWWPAAPDDAVGPAPGPFGLYNLADNVHEWCADYYQADYYAVSAVDNPRGPAASNRRMATAGSWRHDVKFARNAARSSLAPSKRFADFGFRVARSEGFAYVYGEGDEARGS